MSENKISSIQYLRFIFIIPELEMSQVEKQHNIINTSGKSRVFVGKKQSERDKLQSNYTDLT